MSASSGAIQVASGRGTGGKQRGTRKVVPVLSDSEVTVVGGTRKSVVLNGIFDGRRGWVGPASTTASRTPKSSQTESEPCTK